MFSRNELLFGLENQRKIAQKHVAIFGVGGVGGYALECLARCGVEKFTLIDFDTVDISNINRQIIALNSTVGEKKTALFEKRLHDINPNIKIRIFDSFYNENLNSEIFDNQNIDVIVDAIDTTKSKISLLKYGAEHNIFTVTSLGAGNKDNPTNFKIDDIKNIKTKNTFASKIIRILNKEEITTGITAVYSEDNVKPVEKIYKEETFEQNGEEILLKKISPASVSFVVMTAGSYMAYCVIDYILNN